MIIYCCQYLININIVIGHDVNRPLTSIQAFVTLKHHNKFMCLWCISFNGEFIQKSVCSAKYIHHMFVVCLYLFIYLFFASPENLYRL